MRDVIFAVFLIAATVSSELLAINRIQICANSCESSLCKELIDELEFMLDSSKDFLLPPCNLKEKSYLNDEFRIIVSQKAKHAPMQLFMSCPHQSNCFAREYDVANLKIKELSRDIKNTILNQPTSLAKTIAAPIEAPTKPEKLTQTAVQKKSPKVSIEPMANKPRERKEEKVQQSQKNEVKKNVEWDRVLVRSMELEESQAPMLEVRTSANQTQKGLGHVTMSFGGETWNYYFLSETQKENVSPIHARVYPRALLTTTIWPTFYSRAFLEMSASIMSFRLHANQPVEGDGQMIGAQTYQTKLIGSLLMPFFGLLHLGGDIGYEFQGTFVDQHFLNEKSVTIVPGYQSHALRVGPRIILGHESNKGSIDLSFGFYPVISYFETPDEPAKNRETFAFCVDGIVRMVLSRDLFSDVSLKYKSIYVQYKDDVQRLTVEGDPWGNGYVRSHTASASIGLGYLF